MKIRAELHLGEHSSKVILLPRPEEKDDHLALKLAAVTMFLPHEPIVDPSADHPALSGIDLRPDVCVLNVAGDMLIWIECGEVSINKLDKVTRRWPEARIVVLKPTKHKALLLRESLKEQVRHGDRVEIWAWPDNSFQDWLNAMQDKTEIFGEAQEKSFNLVVNQTAYAVDLLSF